MTAADATPPTGRVELLPAEVRDALAEDLAHWEPASAELAGRIMAAPLMANDSRMFRRVLDLEADLAETRRERDDARAEAFEEAARYWDTSAARVRAVRGRAAEIVAGQYETIAAQIRAIAAGQDPDMVGEDDEIEPPADEREGAGGDARH